MSARPIRTVLGVLQTLILASVVSFVVLRAVPGDPARLIAGSLATEDTLTAIRSQLGLDQPLISQYFKYVGDFVTLNWGYSYSNGAQVTEVMANRLPATMELALWAFIFAVIGALVLATLSSYRKGIFAGVSKILSLIGLGTPQFWVALVLILVFSSGLGILPGASGRLTSFLQPPPKITGLYSIDALLSGQFVVFSDAMAHLLLPALCLAIIPASFLVRLITANQNDVAKAAFVTVVRSKGVTRWQTHRRHVLHNALLPAISSAGMILATMITGSVLVEQVFNWPGIGQVLVQGIQRQDFAVVQAFVLLSAVLYVVTNSIADGVMSLVDPRLRVGGGR
ncbi:ABC transporter permease subunit [Nakamurella sp. YIM 132087]|uniref:ABC transporter permease subunit n=1 Tax=Nakamurella alba TaxID=2665158 RepID=A0A7K1FJA3_9ACTN|nr:ABC transporter permease [Nakamurella alba]MTD14150.1 ABC transporter permease subunit [Nakamurella alba]